MIGLIARLALRLGVPAWLLTGGLAVLLAGAAWLTWTMGLADHENDLIYAHENGVPDREAGPGCRPEPVPARR